MTWHFPSALRAPLPVCARSSAHCVVTLSGARLPGTLAAPHTNMASDAQADGDALAQLRHALAAVESPATALVAACAAPFVADALDVPEALADARPNPGEASDATAELLGRLDALIGTLQSARATLAGGRAVEARVTRQRGEDAGFASLPHAVALRIFAALPADLRARCATVCRDWRAILLPSSLWAHLDLSKSSGVTCRVGAAALLGASARARGQLQSLQVDGGDSAYQALQRVLEANRTTLRDVRYFGFVLTFRMLDAWLAAVPTLRSMRLCFEAPLVDAVRLLRKAPPLGPLLVDGLRVKNLREWPADDVATLLGDLCATMHAHAPLRQLELHDILLEAQAVDALVDVVLARKMFLFKLINCSVTAASGGALARLLRNSDALEHFSIISELDDDAPLLDAAAGAELAAALAANNTLQTLSLGRVKFWADMDAAAAVLRAAVGHPSLTSLILPDNAVTNKAQAGAQLAAVIAANAPALTALNVTRLELANAGLAPLMEALSQNTHLRELRCRGMGMSEGFARDIFLPAIRANTSLRKLDAGSADMQDEVDTDDDVGDDDYRYSHFNFKFKCDQSRKRDSRNAQLQVAEELVKARAAAETHSDIELF